MMETSISECVLFKSDPFRSLAGGAKAKAAPKTLAAPGTLEPPGAETSPGAVAAGAGGSIIFVALIFHHSGNFRE